MKQWKVYLKWTTTTPKPLLLDLLLKSRESVAGPNHRPISLKLYSNATVKTGKRFINIWREEHWARSDLMGKSTSARLVPKRWRNWSEGPSFWRHMRPYKRKNVSKNKWFQNHKVLKRGQSNYRWKSKRSPPLLLNNLMFKTNRKSYLRSIRQKL